MCLLKYLKNNNKEGRYKLSKSEVSKNLIERLFPLIFADSSVEFVSTCFFFLTKAIYAKNLGPSSRDKQNI